MPRLTVIALLVFTAVLAAAGYGPSAPAPQAMQTGEELEITSAEGQYGGTLIVGQRAEPRTLNPVTATDAVIEGCTAQ